MEALILVGNEAGNLNESWSKNSSHLEENELLQLSAHQLLLHQNCLLKSQGRLWRRRTGVELISKSSILQLVVVGCCDCAPA
ncbi:hypothetical protein P8452_17190 [Trifolium repens]|nr:hypothetical protein P8452_17190 [Trifolium repens]